MKLFLAQLALLAVVGCAGCKHEEAGPPIVAQTPLSVSLVLSEPQQLTIEFTNGSDTDIRILKPLDGSYHSWLMPHYKYSMSNEKTSDFGLWPRCGNFGYPYSDTNWPDDYVITVPAGRSKSLDSYIPFIIPEAGEYTIEFEYRFEPDSDALPTGEHTYPDDLWRGRVKSNPIQMQLPAKPLGIG